MCKVQKGGRWFSDLVNFVLIQLILNSVIVYSDWFYIEMFNRGLTRCGQPIDLDQMYTIEGCNVNKCSRDYQEKKKKIGSCYVGPHF